MVTKFYIAPKCRLPNMYYSSCLVPSKVAYSKMVKALKKSLWVETDKTEGFQRITWSFTTLHNNMLRWVSPKPTCNLKTSVPNGCYEFNG